MKLPDAIREFLAQPHFAILATVSAQGRVQATPVWYLLDDGEVIINTSQGRAKLRNMQANAYVALTVYDRDNPYRYVQIRGPVTLDPAAGARDIDRLSQRYRGRPYEYPTTDAPEKRVTARIRPERFTAGGITH